MKLSTETKKNLPYCITICAALCAFTFGIFVGQHGRDIQRRAERFWQTRVHPSQIDARINAVCIKKNRIQF